MAATYTLTLGLDSGKAELAFQTQKTVTGLGKTTLISLNIQKEMYMPAHIEAVLQIELAGDISTMDKISYKSLLNKKASLNDGQKDIAKDYVIFECVPEYKPSEKGTSLYLTLHIYSPDKVLTLRKYNKCYVAKKFASEIFKKIAAKYSDLLPNVSIENLQHIFIKNEADGSKTEFIQPYLVQFEESALNFLARSANRCGEFMFYENGIWQLGFKPSAAVEIKQFASLTFNEYRKKEDVDYYDTNYLLSEAGQKKLQTDMETRSYTGPKDENLALLVEGESNFMEALSYYYDFKDPSLYLYKMNEWLQKSDATEIVASIILNITKNVISAAGKNGDIEYQWTKDYIDPYRGNKEHTTVVDKKTVVSVFSNYNALDHFKQNFYIAMQKLEESVTGDAIHINFGTYYQPLLLGDVIKVLGKEYVIVKISATCKQNTTVENAGQYTTLEIDAVPAVQGVYYPPKETFKVGRTEPQVAIVSNNKDPRDLGRVQIRYPWQPETKDVPSSPWIRVTQSFASKDSGIKFLPQVGDEIMVDYEQGEMERPFMLGAMATESRKVDIGENLTAYMNSAVAHGLYNDGHAGFFKNDFIIKSVNGQYLKFVTPSNSSFVNMATSFSPAIGAWLKYIPLKNDFITYASTAGRKLSGGITMGDAYGFFNFTMSTEKRCVYISSSMGDVEIDALTGITISAPNGNVKIEGKNVEIVAGNTLTMKSGENVSKMKGYFGESSIRSVTGKLVSGTVKEAKKMTKLIDLTLLRTVLEAFMKPVGGTMLIKSYRFMRLEAGKGETKLPHAAYKKNSKTQKEVIDKMVTEFKIKDTLASAMTLMDSWNKFYEEESKNLEICKAKYINCKYDLAEQVNIGCKMANVFCQINGKTLKLSGKALEKQLIKEISSAASIIQMAKDKDTKCKKAYEKLATLKYPENRNGNNIVVTGKATREAAKELFYTAKRTQISNINKDKALDGCLTFSDLNYIIDVTNEEEYKKDIKDTLSSVFDTLISEMQKDQDMTITKRKILYDVLQKLKEKKYITIKNESGFWNNLSSDHTRNMSPLDKSVCEDSSTWEDYLDCVKFYEEEEKNIIKMSLKWLLENNFGDFYKGWEEDHIYHPEMEGGEILISDTDGNTRTIKGDYISKQAVNPFKEALKKIKKI